MKQHFVSSEVLEEGNRPNDMSVTSLKFHHFTFEQSTRTTRAVADIDVSPWKRTVTAATTAAILSKSYEVTVRLYYPRRVHAAGTGSHFARSEVNELCVNELGAEEKRH